MKIAIKHRTNNCKDYMGSHRYYWKFNRAYDTAEQYLFVRRIGLGYTVGFLRRDVTARSRGGGRRWCKQLSGLEIFLKKRLERSTRLAWRDKIITCIWAQASRHRTVSYLLCRVTARTVINRAVRIQLLLLEYSVSSFVKILEYLIPEVVNNYTGYGPKNGQMVPR